MSGEEQNNVPSELGKHSMKGNDQTANSGINAMHINSAREMVELHTRARLPSHMQKRTENRNSSMPKPQGGRPLMNSSFPKAGSNISIPAKSHTGPCSNPQCDHCGQVIIPSPKSSFPIQDHPSITINDWSIYTIKRPILNSAELDNLGESRFEFPLPEMIFGNNLVKITNDKNNCLLEFNALDALDSLDETSNLKVSYHKEWLESRRSSSTSSSDIIDKSEKAQKEISNKDLKKLTDLESLKPYDWTYSPNYKGTCKNIQFTETDAKIPVEKLMKPDPILFFDELILFEDELGDNGISMLSTKIRVMPSCLLLLCRFFLRIDNVIFRIRDTRVYVDFDTNVILREYKVQECPYDEVLKRITSKSNNDPKKLLRDTMWVSQNIPILSCTVETSTVS